MTTVRAVLSDAAEPAAAGAAPADLMPSADTVTAAHDAERAEVCAWIVPDSDGGFHVVVAELDDAAATSLLTALRADSALIPDTVAGTTSFTGEIDSELGTTSVTYVLDGELWVTVIGTLDPASSPIIAAEAFASTRAAG